MRRVMLRADGACCKPEVDRSESLKNAVASRPLFSRNAEGWGLQLNQPQSNPAEEVRRSIELVTLYAKMEP